jgi:malate dehydrogenase (oxaloacetate-decarboxylating)(NADP+)
MLILPRGVFFFADTYVAMDPSPDEIVEIALQGRDHLERFHLEARIALLSYSNFGSRDGDTAYKMREAYQKLKARDPELIVEGEMQGDVALSQMLRERYIPDTALKGEANLMIFPTLDAANLAMTLVKGMTDALTVGPILMGTAQPAHILAPSVTSRGIVNMTSVAVTEAIDLERRGARPAPAV